MDYKKLTERLLKFDSAMGGCEEIGCPDLCAPGEDCIIYNAVTAITELLSRAEAAEARAEAAEKKAADVRPAVRGRWDKDTPFGYKCSLCGCIMPGETNFCPKCGADMRGGSEQ